MNFFHLFLVFDIVLVAQNSFCQEHTYWASNDFIYNRPSSSFRIGFYNVENLFDIYDDPQTRDEEFTPSGEKHWTQTKYDKKLQSLARTIVGMGGWSPIDILGMCEIENRLVLTDLITVTMLSKVPYDIIHEDSPDSRGIDVALIYRTDRFKVLDYQYLVVTDPKDTTFKTRSILYAKGLLPNQDTLHYFVNHWPSRRGGQSISEPKRLLAAQIVRNQIEIILFRNPNANIVICGDFNDEPIDISINTVLQAKKREDVGHYSYALINLMHEMEGKAGTHIFQGKWGILDQFMISQGLLKSERTHISRSAQIYNAEWLLSENSAGIPSTNRTFQGPMYQGGYSDHLPILLDLECR